MGKVYVSKVTNFLFLIENGVFDYVKTQEGYTERVEKRPTKWAVFVENPDFTEHQADAIQRMFFKAQGAKWLGAQPLSETTIIDDVSSPDYGDVGVATDPRTKLSYFDTGNPEHCPPDDRELYEEKLDALLGGQFYIRLDQDDKQPKPYPSYLKHRSDPMQVIDMLRDAEIDPQVAVDYELSMDAPNEDLLNEIAKYREDPNYGLKTAAKPAEKVAK